MNQHNMNTMSHHRGAIPLSMNGSQQHHHLSSHQNSHLQQQQPPHSHMMGMRSPNQAQLSQQQHSSQAQHMMLPGMMQQQPPPTHMSSRGASVGDMMRQQNGSASHSMHGGGGPHTGSSAGAGSINPHRRRTSASSLGDVGQSSSRGSYPSHHHSMQQMHGAQPPPMVNSHLDRSLTSSPSSTNLKNNSSSVVVPPLKFNNGNGGIIRGIESPSLPSMDGNNVGSSGNVNTKHLQMQLQMQMNKIQQQQMQLQRMQLIQQQQQHHGGNKSNNSSSNSGSSNNFFPNIPSRPTNSPDSGKINTMLSQQPLSSHMSRGGTMRRRSEDEHSSLSMIEKIQNIQQGLQHGGGGAHHQRQHHSQQQQNHMHYPTSPDVQSGMMSSSSNNSQVTNRHLMVQQHQQISDSRSAKINSNRSNMNKLDSHLRHQERDSSQRNHRATVSPTSSQTQMDFGHGGSADNNDESNNLSNLSSYGPMTTESPSLNTKNQKLGVDENAHPTTSAVSRTGQEYPSSQGNISRGSSVAVSNASGNDFSLVAQQKQIQSSSNIPPLVPLPSLNNSLSNRLSNNKGPNGGTNSRYNPHHWEDKTIHVSRLITGGSTVNGFLRATAATQRLKKQRARQRRDNNNQLLNSTGSPNKKNITGGMGGIDLPINDEGNNNAQPSASSAAIMNLLDAMDSTGGTNCSRGNMGTSLLKQQSLNDNSIKKNATFMSVSRPNASSLKRVATMAGMEPNLIAASQQEFEGEEQLKSDTMNPRSIRKLRSYLSEGVSFCSSLEQQILSILAHGNSTDASQDNGENTDLVSRDTPAASIGGESGMSNYQLDLAPIELKPPEINVASPALTTSTEIDLENRNDAVVERRVSIEHSLLDGKSEDHQDTNALFNGNIKQQDIIQSGGLDNDSDVISHSNGIVIGRRISNATPHSDGSYHTLKRANSLSSSSKRNSDQPLRQKQVVERSSSPLDRVVTPPQVSAGQAAALASSSLSNPLVSHSHADENSALKATEPATASTIQNVETVAEGNPNGSTLRKFRKSDNSKPNDGGNNATLYDSSGNHIHNAANDSDTAVSVNSNSGAGEKKQRKLTRKDVAYKAFDSTRFRSLQVGDWVAAHVSTSNSAAVDIVLNKKNNKIWILARVTRPWHISDKVSHADLLGMTEMTRQSLFQNDNMVYIRNVEDRDGDDASQAISRHLVLPLPRSFGEAADWGTRCRRGMRVYAMYPTTTKFYCATVIDNGTYCRGEDDIIVVEFDDDQGETGSFPQRHIPARFVTIIPRDFPGAQIIRRRLALNKPQKLVTTSIIKNSATIGSSSPPLVKASTNSVTELNNASFQQLANHCPSTSSTSTADSISSCKLSNYHQRVESNNGSNVNFNKAQVTCSAIMPTLTENSEHEKNSNKSISTLTTAPTLHGTTADEQNKRFNVTDRANQLFSPDNMEVKQNISVDAGMDGDDMALVSGDDFTNELFDAFGVGNDDFDIFERRTTDDNSSLVDAFGEDNHIHINHNMHLSSQQSFFPLTGKENNMKSAAHEHQSLLLPSPEGGVASIGANGGSGIVKKKNPTLADIQAASLAAAAGAASKGENVSNIHQLKRRRLSGKSKGIIASANGVANANGQLRNHNNDTNITKEYDSSSVSPSLNMFSTTEASFYDASNKNASAGGMMSSLPVGPGGAMKQKRGKKKMSDPSEDVGFRKKIRKL